MEDFEALTEELIENLFSGTPEGGNDNSGDDNGDNENSDGGQKKNNKTTEVDVDTLFTDSPESVSSEEDDDDEGKEKNTTSAKAGISPKNFYSSVAEALVEDGATPDLDVTNVKDAESFANAIKSYVESQLTETLKRINDALNFGVEPQEIQFYENTIKSLNSITDEYIEDEKNEEFRKRAIYQDLINKGYSKEDASEEVEEIISNGTDVKKAKRAVASMKNFYTLQYKDILDNAKEEDTKNQNLQKEKLANLKKNMLEESNVFGDLEVSKEVRLKAFDAITKPIYKDSDTGEYYTALQKYEKENKDEFLMKLGFIFALSDGFKSFDKVVKGKVNKESKKALRELEHTLSNTRRTSDGSLKYADDLDDDDSQTMFKGYSLDI